MWPAALGLFAFVWMELVYTHNVDLGPVRLWMAVYLALMILGGALFGNRFYERADPFEVYSSLVAQLSIWGRRDDLLVVRSPLANLDTTAATPGLVAVVSVLFGSTAFDAFRESTRWLTFIQDTGLLDVRSRTTSACLASASGSALSSGSAAWPPAWEPTSGAASCPRCSPTR